jgi:hypothetical protein
MVFVNGEQLRIGSFFVVAKPLYHGIKVKHPKVKQVPSPPLQNDQYPEAWRWTASADACKPEYQQICLLEGIDGPEIASDVKSVTLKARIFLRCNELGETDRKYEIVATKKGN